MQEDNSTETEEEPINIKGVNYGTKLWQKHYKLNKKLGNGLIWKLRQASFFDFEDPNERLRIALEILDKYSLSTAERYFAQLKYGGYISVPNIKTLFLAKEKFGSTNRRAPQIRIPAIDEMHKFIRYLYSELEVRKSQKISANLIQYDMELGLIIAILFVYNSALRLAEVLRLNTHHLRELSNGSETIELKMKSAKQWNVIYHKALYVLLNNMRNIFENLLVASERDGREILQLKLFQFSREYVRVGVKKLFAKANDNKLPPKGFGLHTLRYYIGSELAQRNLKLTQMVLNHKNIHTSAIYVKYDNLKFQRKLNDLESASQLIVAAKQQLQ